MSKTITIPSSAQELEEFLGDDAKLASLFDSGKPRPEFAEFLKAYAQKVGADDGVIADQVRGQLQSELAHFYADNGQRPGRLDLTPGNRPDPTSALFNRRAPGARVDQLLATEKLATEDFLRMAWFRNQEPAALELQDKIRSIVNEFGSSTVPSDGGFLIPETLRSTLLQVALEMAIVRPRATVIPMETLRVPFPTIDETTHAGSVYGGMIGYWTEEAGELTDSSAKFGRVVLDAKKLTGYSEVPNELFLDSVISFAAFLGTAWPRAIAFFEDLAFFSGTGVGEPLGFLRAPAAVSVAKESGQPADTIVWENLAKMYARMLPSSLGSAVWVANINTFPELATMALSVGTGGGPIWLRNGDEGPPMTILGRPVAFTEKAATIGDAGDINFVDFSYYLLGDRQTMSLETSPHFKFKNDQTAVRIIERVDGRPWIKSAITPAVGTDTLSPFVKIAERA